MPARAHHPSITVPECHDSERSFCREFFGRAPCSCACRGLRCGHLCVVGAAQHLKAALAMCVWLQVMMATRPIPLALASLKVVHLAVASGRGAARANAMVFGAAFRSRSGKAPNMFALPGPAAFIGAPRSPAFTRDLFIAPMAASHFASPLRQRARNSLGNKLWKLQLVNRMFQLLAFRSHGRS